MTTYNTGNPLGSSAAKDLYDNAQNLDFAVNSITQTLWRDRFGKPRKTWYGIEKLASEAIAAFGYITLDSFQAGASLPNNQLTLPNQVLRDTSNGEYYRWDGIFPKTVPAGSTPGTTGGVSIGAWLSVGDATLRGQISDPEGATKYPELQLSRWRDEGDIRGWGAIVGGETLCDTNFQAAESEHKIIYVPEGNWRLSTPMILGLTSQYYGPGVLIFDNAEWWRKGGSAGAGLSEYYTLFYEYNNQSDVSVTFDGTPQEISFASQFTVLAPPSSETTSVKINIEGGFLRLGSAPESIHSYNVLSNGGGKVSPALPDPLTSPVGMMNTSIGARSLNNLTNGENNTAFGARALVSTTSGNNQTGIGFQTLYRSVGSDNTALGSTAGEWLTSGNQNTLLGVNAGGHGRTSSFNTAVGWSALGDNQSGQYNTAVGWRAGGNTDITSFDESVMIGAYSGSYSWGGKNTYVGYRSGAGLNSGSDGTENTAIGFYAMRQHNGADYNTAVGVSALTQITNGQYNVALGHNAGQAVTSGARNVLVGYQSGYVLTGDGNTLIGSGAASLTTSGANNVSIGNGALATNSTGSNNTAIGPNSGRLTIAGANTAALTNTTTIGNDARISADNQVQIGNSATTTYVYGTVQNRSDSRDKADVRNTILGIEFVLGLRPVSGKWNLREDYYNVREVELSNLDDNGQPTVQLEVSFDSESYQKQTKKRNREHQWFIAQDVMALLEKLGIDDFGGIQHHALSGGDDVFSLGYDEFIPPIVSAIQSCWSRIDELEERISLLERK